MKGTLKLISGFFLFVIGVILLFESITYNLIDIFLGIGAVLVIVGAILIINYIIDRNSKDYFSDILNNNNKDDSKPLKVNNQPLNTDNNRPIKKPYNSYRNVPKEIRKPATNHSNDFPKKQPVDSNNSKAVLYVHNFEEDDVDFDKKLNFTPNYDKPLKVTRQPKKRDYSEYFNPDYEENNEIKQALFKDNELNEDNIPKAKLKQPKNSLDDSRRDIKIDINNPDSLPIPKDLKTYILSKSGTITANEAFEEMFLYAKNEIRFEISNLNDMSDKFLSLISKTYSRIIIEEFDVSDISYMILLSSLLRKGVKIKTLPHINKVNLIIDDSHALIISDNDNEDKIQCGAIYTDDESIGEIRSTFDRSWEIAKDLDKNLILNYE